MAGLPIPLNTAPSDLGGEFRNAGRVKFPGIRQVREFTLGHNTAGKAADEGAVAPSEGTVDIDAMVTQLLDESASVLKALREAKELHFSPAAATQNI
jgi:hypothetical protein